VSADRGPKAEAGEIRQGYSLKHSFYFLLWKIETMLGLILQCPTSTRVCQSSLCSTAALFKFRESLSNTAEKLEDPKLKPPGNLRDAQEVSGILKATISPGMLTIPPWERFPRCDLGEVLGLLCDLVSTTATLLAAGHISGRGAIHTLENASAPLGVGLFLAIQGVILMPSVMEEGIW